MASTGREERRRRINLTVAQKLELIKKVESGISVKCLCEKYGIKKQTVSDIRKAKDKLIEYAVKHSVDGYSNKAGLVGSRKHMKVGTQKDLDEAMYKWYVQQKSCSNKVTAISIRNACEQLSENLGIQYSASDGWLWRFRNRHGLRDLKVCNKARGTDTACDEIEMEEGKIEEKYKEFELLICGDIKEEIDIKEEPIDDPLNILQISTADENILKSESQGEQLYSSGSNSETYFSCGKFELTKENTEEVVLKKESLEKSDINGKTDLNVDESVSKEQSYQFSKCESTDIQKNFKCDSCDYRGTCKKDLELHRKIKSYKCSICRNIFATKFNLKQHILTIHEKRKPFQCSICVYSCSQKANLKQHVLSVHSKTKKFKCSICDYTCSQNGHLNQHISAVHDKIKPYKCPICNYTSSKNGNLKQHILNIHDKIKPFICSLCHYTCSKSGHLKQHILAVHEKIKSYKCSLCNYTCSKKEYLKRHILTVHDTSST